MPRTWRGRAARAVARAPVGLYRRGLGFLLGHRMLMLEHRGRRSGLPRYVVLEVVRRLPGGRYVVVAGMGPTSDWYRNVRAPPQVQVWVARVRGVEATARFLDAAEARARLREYRVQRPATWRLLKPVIARVIGHPGQTDAEMFDALPLVELSLATP